MYTVPKANPSIFRFLDNNRRKMLTNRPKTLTLEQRVYARVFKMETLFAILAVAGYSYQTWQICFLYFTYDVVTEVHMKVPEKIDAPALSLCFFYPDAINITAFNDLPEVKIKKERLYINDTQDILNVSDIFKLSPEGDDLMRNQSCRYQMPDSYNLETGDCNKEFAVRKYFKQCYICYEFTPRIKSDISYDFIQLVSRLSFYSTFYEIKINHNLFTATRTVQITVHPMNQYPRSSQAFSETFYRDSSYETENLYHISYWILKQTFLKPPYTTNCRDDKGYEQKHCFCKCIIEKCKAALAKIPFTCILGYAPENKPFKLMAEYDARNKTFTRKLHSIEDECNKKCRQRECFKKTYITQVIDKRNKQQLGLTFRIFAPNQPSKTITFLPRIYPTEFVIYIMGCFGPWFGLSVLSFSTIFDYLFTSIRQVIRNMMNANVR